MHMKKWIFIVCGLALLFHVVSDRTEDKEGGIEVTEDEVIRQEEHTVCPQCNGSGKETCYRCLGDGVIVCNVCNGTKVNQLTNQSCNGCVGTGTNFCPICKGTGSTACSLCARQGENLPQQPAQSSGITTVDDDEKDNDREDNNRGSSDYGYYDCPTCYGSGTCQTCNGKGCTGNPYEGGDPMLCPNCRNHNGKCSVCNGTGKKYGRVK